MALAGKVAGKIAVGKSAKKVNTPGTFVLGNESLPESIQVQPTSDVESIIVTSDMGSTQVQSTSYGGTTSAMGSTQVQSTSHGGPTSAMGSTQVQATLGEGTISDSGSIQAQSSSSTSGKSKSG